MLETLKYTEYEWFLWLNGFHTPFFDKVMYAITHRFTFTPLYIFLIYLIFRFIKKQPFQKLAYVLLSVGLADRITSGLMKPYFQRLRPCHDPAISNIVHTVSDCGGQYGFVSSHAANTFALAVCYFLMFKPLSKVNVGIKYLINFLFIWAIIVSYSRIYIGVHYPSDVIVGGIVGSSISIILFIFLNKLTKNQLITLNNS